MSGILGLSNTLAPGAQTFPKDGKSQRNHQHHPGQSTWMGLGEQGKTFLDSKVHHNMENINGGGEGAELPHDPIRPGAVEGKLGTAEAKQDYGRDAEQDTDGQLRGQITLPLGSGQEKSGGDQGNQLGGGKAEAPENPLLVFVEEKTHGKHRNPGEPAVPVGTIGNVHPVYRKNHRKEKIDGEQDKAGDVKAVVAYLGILIELCIEPEHAIDAEQRNQIPEVL